MTTVILIASIIIIYYAICKFAGLCESKNETLFENLAKNRINETFENNQFKVNCLKVTISPIAFSLDETESGLFPTYIITVNMFWLSLAKEYTCLIDGFEQESVNGGIDTIIIDIKKDIADQELVC